MTADEFRNVTRLMDGERAVNGRCCVFQPFDKGAFDKRYDDIIVPAITAAGLEAYRVDRDDGAVIPIDTLHDEIKAATLCLADIGTRNPNVMYELGFAIASGKEVVIICAAQSADTFPFDIRHRGIISYAAESVRDFEKLKCDITNRLGVLLRKQTTTHAIAAASPIKATHGLRAHEVACLAFVMVNAEIGGSGATSFSIKEDMRNAGYTAVAAQLGLISLCRIGLIETFEDKDENGYPFPAFRLTSSGQDWLVANQDRLEIQTADDPEMQKGIKQQLADDDVPF